MKETEYEIIKKSDFVYIVFSEHDYGYKSITSNVFGSEQAASDSCIHLEKQQKPLILKIKNPFL